VVSRWASRGLLLAAVGAWGCDEAAGPGPNVTAEDSAGVVVLTNQIPASADPLRTVGSPEVTIGSTGSGLNRVIGAARLSDGRVVIADGGDATIQYFSARGALLGAVGRAGDGPSEFRTLQAIGTLPGDTVWAYDFSHHRVTFVSPTMEVLQEVSVSPPLGPLLAVGILPGGPIVLGESWSSTRLAESTEPGLMRAPVSYVRYSRTGELLDTIAVVAGREVLLSSENGRSVMGTAPMGRSAVHALTGRWIVIGDQASHELRFFSATGGLMRILRWDGGSLHVSPELESSWRSARLASVAPELRTQLNRVLTEQGIPEQRPAYGQILPAPNGGLWVANYSIDMEEPGAWSVFASDGSWSGSISMPPRFRPLVIGEDWVLGVSRDELDVETVELRHLNVRAVSSQ
jgi:hypothetical protein